jgi:hypothetical protein
MKKKQHKDDLYNIHFSPIKITVIRSRRRKWEIPVACMGEMGIVYDILANKPERRDRLEDICVDGRIILK